MLYGVGAAVAGIACLYLLLRRANAFAPDVTPPERLRRWTTVFFAVLAIGHLWYLPVAVLTSSDDLVVCMLVGGLLDSVTMIPLTIVLQLCMLQDRRRPLWPVGVMTIPLAVLMVAGIVTRSTAYMPMAYGYLLLVAIGLIIYMVRAVRQYGRWLRDNFADLEHKEVWQSFVVLAVIVLVLGYYVAGNDGSITYEYVCQVCGLVFVGHLLWRVETLSDLSLGIPTDDGEYQSSDGKHQPSEKAGIQEGKRPSPDASTDATYEQIGTLLKQHCEGAQLYLQHGLTLVQLAQAIGSNRTYLDLYFSTQNTTYNTYINNLRILHFVSLYREAVAAGRNFTAQQLALDSGYRNYRTFSLAFRQRMGQNVTEWMQETAEQDAGNE
jgi:AraC-like DNA-binding protein